MNVNLPFTEDELVQEINFQAVVLGTIEDSDPNSATTRAEIKATIKTLSGRLYSLQHGLPIDHRSFTSSAQKSIGDSAQSQSNAYLNTTWSWDGVQDGATTSAKVSSRDKAFSDIDQLGPQMQLPARKRSYSNHVGGNAVSYSESKRATPSPYISSSDDEAFPDLDEFFQSQKAVETRIQMEKKDAELARSMQNTYGNQPQSNPQTNNSLYNLSRPHTVSSYLPDTTTQAAGSSQGYAHRGTGQYTSQSISDHKSNPIPSSTVQNGIGQSQSVARSIKSEVKNESPLVNRFDRPRHLDVSNLDSPSAVRANVPGTYPDSSGDDSDIEIIPSSAFRDNGRHPRPTQQANSLVTENTSQRPPHGNQPVPSWVNTPIVNSSSQFGYAQSPNTSIGGISNGGMINAEMGMGSIAPGHHLYANDYLADSFDSINSEFRRPTGTFAYDQLPSLMGQGGYQASHGNNGQGSSYQTPFGETSYPGYEMENPVYGSFGEARMSSDDQLKSLLENIRPDIDTSPTNREGTPEGMKFPLYEHQKVALTWLKTMEESSTKGGILGDDMGLGKTISALALMVSRPSSELTRKTNLVVGPVALVRQWEKEIRTELRSSHQMSTYIVHGSSKRPSWDVLSKYDVVLTTYGTIGTEFKRFETYRMAGENAGRVELTQQEFKQLFPLLGPRSKFYRIFLDEAQCIKNRNTLVSRAVCHLSAIYRFCLTGTPLMNGIGELYPLIRFLQIKPYNEYNRFQQDFRALLKKNSGHTRGNIANAMKKVQAILKAILLRRTKETEIDGKPIIQLPPKTTEIHHVVFSEDEHELYKALENRTQIQFNKYVKAGTTGKNYSNILVLLLRLRQCCCHPHLITDFEELAAGPDSDVMIKLAEGLGRDVVERLLNSEGFECPVCYDGVENPLIVIPCGHSTCAECCARLIDQAVQQHVAAGNEGQSEAKCPTCRGKLEGKEIIDYVTFKKVHNPDTTHDGNLGDRQSDDNDDSSEDSSDSDSEEESDDEGDGSLKDFVVPDDFEDGDVVAAADDDDDDELDELGSKPKKQEANKPEPRKRDGGRKKPKKGKGKGKQQNKEKRPHRSLAMLKKEASNSASGRKRYMKYLRKRWQPSAKLDKAVELLERFQEEGQKTIVFSQFVSLLDLLQVPLDERKMTCERYDGAMTADKRQKAVDNFTDNPNSKIMLISLKAGNAGLNLVAASRVIILDPFWNPFIEMQAVDRAYRIGQQKPVEVHRILIESTVEDRIIELQEQKRDMVNAALDEKANQSLGRLGIKQIAYLFGIAE